MPDFTVTEDTRKTVSRRTGASWHPDGWFYNADCEGTVGSTMVGPFETEEAAQDSITEHVFAQRGCPVRIYPGLEVANTNRDAVKRLLRTNGFHIAAEGTDATHTVFALAEPRSLRPAPAEVDRATKLLAEHGHIPTHVRIPVGNTHAIPARSTTT